VLGGVTEVAVFMPLAQVERKVVTVDEGVDVMRADGGCVSERDIRGVSVRPARLPLRPISAEVGGLSVVRKDGCKVMGVEAVKIIVGRERRRRWSVAAKLRILAECDEPGAQISAVAARPGIYRSLVFQWRRQARDGLLVAEPVPGFVPVRLHAPAPPPVEGASGAPSAPMAMPARRASPPPRPPAVIKIELPDGVRLRVGEEVGATALRRVLAALRG